MKNEAETMVAESHAAYKEQCKKGFYLVDKPMSLAAAEQYIKERDQEI